MMNIKISTSYIQSYQSSTTVKQGYLQPSTLLIELIPIAPNEYLGVGPIQ